MTYDIYFHNDFDGRASAAVILAFLRSRGDAVEHYIPVDFDLEKQWLDEKFFEKHRLFRGVHNPAIIVDFLYHPGAAFWFDHHGTSIKRHDWRKKFRKSRRFHWDTSYPSCCHWVYDALGNNFRWKPPRHLAELVRWADIIDGARYISARQAIAMKEPALQLEGFVERTVFDHDVTVEFIGHLAAMPLAQIARMPEVAREVVAYRKEIAKSLAFYKKNVKLFGNTAFIDLTKGNVKRLLYGAFYFHPKIRYAIRMVQKGKWIHMSAGENPWRPTGKIHFGTLMQTFGGGGHKTVGGVEFYDRAKADAALAKTIETLNTKG